MSTTATTVINGAFSLIGVKDPVEALDATLAQDGLRRLNNMIAAWSLMAQAVPFVGRQVFPTTIGKGGPSNPYTIGVGGDFNTSRPDQIDAAALLINNPTPVEVPIDTWTEQAWESNQVKDLQGPQFTGLYYQRTYAAGLGSIYLWPVPNSSTYSLVIYRGQQMPGFVDLVTSYDLPPGYDEAYEYNLALRLCAPYARQVSPDVLAFAQSSFALIQVSNLDLNDAPNDYVLRTAPSRPYNILAGQ